MGGLPEACGQRGGIRPGSGSPGSHTWGHQGTCPGVEVTIGGGAFALPQVHKEQTPHLAWLVKPGGQQEA